MSLENEPEDDLLDLEGFEDEAGDDDAAEPADDLDEDEDGDEGDDQPEPPSDNATIRRMRAEIRQLRREARERAKPAVPTEDIGEKPKLEDFDYDETRFAEAVETWTAKKLQAEAATKAAQADDPMAKDWTAKLTAFQQSREQIVASNPDAEDALLDVDAALGAGSMAAIVQAFGDKAPTILLKIGADADTLDRFAEIRNPLELVAEAARLEAPVTRKKPALDTPVRGGAPSVKPAAKTLESLKAKADKTGDYTAYFAAKRRLRERGKAV